MLYQTGEKVAPVKHQLPDALSELRALRSAVLEHALVAITDPSGRITFVNDKFCAVSKYPREELVGQEIRIVNSAHHPKEFMQQLWTTLAEGRPWQGQFRNRAGDGSFYWVETTIFPQLNEAGEPLRHISVGTDVTEFVALQKVGAAFETVMKTTTDHIYFKNRDSRFIRTSEAHMRHFGVTHLDELKGKTDLDFFSDEHAIAAAQDEQAIVRSGEPILNKEEKETHADGLVTWALTSKMPWHDKDGKIIGIMGVSRDITDLKQAQQAAAQWEARFKFLLETLPLGISWAHVAEDGRVTQRLINDEHLRLCGITLEEAMCWDTFRRLTHPDDIKRQDAFNFNVAQGKSDRFSLEKRYLRSDGRTVWVRLNYRMRQGGDGSLEDLYAAVDITERKEAEDQLRVSELLLHLTGQLTNVGNSIVELPDRAVRWNEQACLLHDVPPDFQPTFDRAVEFYTPECRVTFRQAFEACARDGTPYDLELDMITAKGHRVRVRIMGQVYIWDGRPQRVLEAMQEIGAGLS